MPPIERSVESIKYRFDRAFCHCSRRLGSTHKPRCFHSSSSSHFLATARNFWRLTATHSPRFAGGTGCSRSSALETSSYLRFSASASALQRSSYCKSCFLASPGVTLSKNSIIRLKLLASCAARPWLDCSRRYIAAVLKASILRLLKRSVWSLSASAFSPNTRFLISPPRRSVRSSGSSAPLAKDSTAAMPTFLFCVPPVNQLSALKKLSSLFCSRAWYWL